MKGTTVVMLTISGRSRIACYFVLDSLKCMGNVSALAWRSAGLLSDFCQIQYHMLTHLFLEEELTFHVLPMESGVTPDRS